MGAAAIVSGKDVAETENDGLTFQFPDTNYSKVQVEEWQ